MGYILQYFDDLIHSFSENAYSVLNNAKAGRVSLEKEIIQESSNVITHLREYFYNEKNIDIYFKRIAGRLIQYKEHIESHVTHIEHNLVLINHPKSNFIKLENYYQFYEEVMRILIVIIKEFSLSPDEGTDDSTILKHKVIKKDSNEIYCDHSVLKNQILNDKQPDTSILKKYKLELDESEIFNTKKLLENAYKDIANLPYNFIMDIYPDSLDYEFSDYVEEFFGDYIMGNQSFKRRFYLNIAKYLKKSCEDIKNIQDQESYVINFFIFNNLCAEEVLHYFKREILLILINDNAEDIHKYLLKQKERLLKIAQAEDIKYMNYGFSRSEEIPLIKQLDQVLTDTIDDCELNRPDYKQILEEDSSKSEKIDFLETVEVLGLLTKLMIDSNLIKHHKQKALITRVLSKSFLTHGNSFESDSLEKALYATKNKSEVINTTKAVLTNMGYELQKIKKNQKT